MLLTIHMSSPLKKKKNHKRKYKSAENTVRKQEQQEDFISTSA